MAGVGGVFLPRKHIAQLKRCGVGVGKGLVVKQTAELGRMPPRPSTKW